MSTTPPPLPLYEAVYFASDSKPDLPHPDSRSATLSVSFPLRRHGHFATTGPIRLCSSLLKLSEGLNGCSEQASINTAPLHKRWTHTTFERDGRFYDIFDYT